MADRVNGMKKKLIYASLVILVCGGMCGGAVKTSNSGSGGPGFKPRPSLCLLRQGTLLDFVSLHPGVKMGTSDILVGGGGAGNPARD